jgi:hypothetical protein
MKHQISIKTTNNVLSVEDFKAHGLTKNDVIGVVLQTEIVGMAISLDQWEEIWCSEGNCKEFNEACGEAEALQTLSGLELTCNIVKQNEKDGESMTAAMRCWQYEKGDLQWYLPCLYELGTIIAYRDELNEIFKMLDADIIDEDNWGWSGSESSSHIAWSVGFGNGLFYYNLSKCGSFVVRAVSAFSPLERGDFSSPSGNDNREHALPPMTEEAAIEFLRSQGYTGVISKQISI